MARLSSLAIMTRERFLICAVMEAAIISMF
jgi:hypothetical protein